MDLVTFCRKNEIAVEPHSPIAYGVILNQTEIKEMADKYGVRWKIVGEKRDRNKTVSFFVINLEKIENCGKIIVIGDENRSIRVQRST